MRTVYDDGIATELRRLLGESTLNMIESLADVAELRRATMQSS